MLNGPWVLVNWTSIWLPEGRVILAPLGSSITGGLMSQTKPAPASSVAAFPVIMFASSPMADSAMSFICSSGSPIMALATPFAVSPLNS